MNDILQTWKTNVYQTNSYLNFVEKFKIEILILVEKFIRNYNLHYQAIE